jgi:hypothetical protein
MSLLKKRLFGLGGKFWIPRRALDRFQNLTINLKVQQARFCCSKVAKVADAAEAKVNADAKAADAEKTATKKAVKKTAKTK